MLRRFLRKRQEVSGFRILQKWEKIKRSFHIFSHRVARSKMNSQEKSQVPRLGIDHRIVEWELLLKNLLVSKTCIGVVQQWLEGKILEFRGMQALKGLEQTYHWDRYWEVSGNFQFQLHRLFGLGNVNKYESSINCWQGSLWALFTSIWWDSDTTKYYFFPFFPSSGEQVFFFISFRRGEASRSRRFVRNLRFAEKLWPWTCLTVALGMLHSQVAPPNRQICGWGTQRFEPSRWKITSFNKSICIKDDQGKDSNRSGSNPQLTDSP